MIADTIIRTGETNPKDIVLYVPPDSSLAYPRAAQDTTVYLWASSTEFQSGSAVESKLKRWTGTEWVTVGTIVVFQ
jgi:hypothetical protein